MPGRIPPIVWSAMPRKTKDARPGRVTPKGGPPKRKVAAAGPGSGSTPLESGRYTPPIPRDVRHSPRWFPWALLTSLLLGVTAIILNYIQALPASPTNWYTLGGLIAILVAALAATRFR